MRAHRKAQQQIPGSDSLRRAERRSIDLFPISQSETQPYRAASRKPDRRDQSDSQGVSGNFERESNFSNTSSARIQMLCSNRLQNLRRAANPPPAAETSQYRSGTPAPGLGVNRRVCPSRRPATSTPKEPLYSILRRNIYPAAPRQRTEITTRGLRFSQTAAADIPRKKRPFTITRNHRTGSAAVTV